MGVISLSANQDACGRKIGGCSMAELEVYASPVFCLAESHLCSLAGRQGGYRITESLCKVLHHASIYGTFGEFRHTLCHHHIMISGSAYMIVCDAFHYLLSQLAEVSVEFCYIVFEQRLLHCYQPPFTLNDVARITQCIVSVINVQLAVTEVFNLKTSLSLCHCSNSQEIE